jgi:hypothetical protein
MPKWSKVAPRWARKAKWLAFKRACQQFPECLLGDVYCDQVLQPAPGSAYVYCKFPSWRYRQRYYTAVLVTAWSHAVEAIENEAVELASLEVPGLSARDLLLVWFNAHRGATAHEPASITAWRAAYNAHVERLMALPRRVTPVVKVRPTRNPTAIRLSAVLPVEGLTATAVQEFATWYRSLGEERLAGTTWRGEEVELVARDHGRRPETSS